MKTSVKQAAKTGALPVLRIEFWLDGFPFGVVDGGPTLTKDKRSLKLPSVRTLKSCKTNQMPILSPGSVRRNALAAKLPIRFLVNMPIGAVDEMGFLDRTTSFGPLPIIDDLCPLEP